VIDSFDKPNGLAFLPDQKKLYIIDFGHNPRWPFQHAGLRRRCQHRQGDNDKVFAESFAPGFTDGVRTDIDGNVWCSMGWADPKEDGVRCYGAERRSDWQDPSSRDLRQSVLRRPEAKPPVHVRKHIGLRHLRRDPRRAVAVTAASSHRVAGSEARLARQPLGLHATAPSATQCRSNPVSCRSLPKTGIFQISAGDYRRFRAKIVCP